MNQHYSEAALLETYYTAPGESLPVMMHLADCTECAARYERLERKIRSLAACTHHEPESFWARQRTSIMERIHARQRAAAGARFAAAAALALAIGATVSWPLLESPRLATITADVVVAEDPWQSDALDQYQPLVEWESWVETE